MHRTYKEGSRKNPAKEYVNTKHDALNLLFESMIDTEYDEISLRTALDNILSDRYTLKPLDDYRYHILLSIYYQKKKMIEFCFCLKNGNLISFDLYKGKYDLENFINTVGERLLRLDNFE